MKYIIIFIYTSICVLLFFFNWNLFTAYLDFDIGFGSFSTLPLVAIQIFGLVILLIYIFWVGIKDLKKEVLISGLQKQVVELQKNAEIHQLKNEVKNVIEAENKINKLADES